MIRRSTGLIWIVFQAAFCGHALADPVLVAKGSGAEAPRQPQLAIAAAGQVHIVYGVGQTVYHAQLSNDATTAITRRAFDVPNLALGMRRGPRIGISGKALVVTAVGGKEGHGRDGDLLAWRSSDDGASWQGPVAVNDVPSAAREGLHAMATGHDGTVWCAWLDLRNNKTELYAACSQDQGANWNKNVLVYRSPDGSICECCHPSLAVDRQGHVYVMFRNSLGGNRDLYLASSKDGGKTFAQVAKLGTGAWKLDACPMDGGMLAIDGQGKVFTAWRRADSVFATAGVASREQSLGRGEQPWIAATARGPMQVWTSGRGGDLYLNAPMMREPKKLASNARDPVIVASDYKQGSAVAAWEGKHEGEAAIYAAVVEAN